MQGVENLRSIDEIREQLMRQLRDDFMGWVELDDSTAAELAAAVVSRAEGIARSRNNPPLSPDTRVRTWWASEIASALACARATSLCPGGASWWQGAGNRILEKLREGDASSAGAMQAEALAGTFDFDVDFNWPGTKLADAAPHLAAGATFIAGDGEGNRARVEIVEDGRRRAGRIVPGTWVNPTERLWKEAWDEAVDLLELEEATVRDAEQWFQERGIRLTLEPGDRGWTARLVDSHSGRETSRHGPEHNRMWAAKVAAMRYETRTS